MPTLSDIRKKYPEYDDLSDQDLVDAFHSKFYSDMPKGDFYKSLSYTPTTSVSEGLNTAKGYGEALGSGMVRGAAAMPDTALLSSDVATPLSLEEQSMLGVSAPIADPKTGEAEPSALHPIFGGAVEPYLHQSASPGEELMSAAGSGIVSGLIGPGAPARTAISDVPRVVPWLAKMFHYGVAPAVVGEKVRQATEGTKIPSWVPGVGGKDISGAASTAAGMLASVFSPMAVRPRITPNTITDPIVAQRYRAATEAGIPITAGQLTKDPRLINAELSARPTINQEQKDAFNRAVTSEIGEPSTSITGGGSQSYLGRNFRRIGNDFNNLERTTSINPNSPPVAPFRNPQIYNDLVNVATRNPHHVPEILNVLRSVNPKFSPTSYTASGILPQEAIHDALFRTAHLPGASGSGTRALTGSEYRQLRTALHSAAETPGQSPQVANSMRNVANALDTAMENGLPPDMRGLWGRSRRQYAHALVAQDAIGGTSQAGARQMTPDQFKSSSQKVMGREPYLRRDLERNVLSESAGEFRPLKRTKLPPEPSPIEKAAGYVPVVGPAALKYAPMPLGAYLGYKFGAGPEQATYAILGGMLGEGGKTAAMHYNPYIGPMNPLRQMYWKNQLLPLLEDQTGRRMGSALSRATSAYGQGSSGQ